VNKQFFSFGLILLSTIRNIGIPETCNKVYDVFLTKTIHARFAVVFRHWKEANVKSHGQVSFRDGLKAKSGMKTETTTTTTTTSNVNKTTTTTTTTKNTTKNKKSKSKGDKTEKPTAKPQFSNGELAMVFN